MSEFEMESSLRGETELVLTRKFRAPKSLVFKCFTDPEILPKWLCSCSGRSTMCVIDTEIGGVWRHKIDFGDQGTFDSFGQTLEFDPPNRFVRSDVVNVPVVRESINTESATFSEVEGVTSVELVIRHMSKEARDANAASGVVEGTAAIYKSLDLMLVELQEG